MKKILYILIATMSVIVLTACSNVSKVDITNDFFHSLTQVQDVEKANSYLASNMKQDLNFELSEDAEEGNSEYVKFEEHLKKFAKLTKYTAVEEEEQVKVTLEYPDLAIAIEDAFNEYLTEELEKIMSGVKSTDEEALNSFYVKINEELEVLEPEMKEVKGFVKFTEESGETLISHIDESLLSGLSYGLGELKPTE